MTREHVIAFIDGGARGNPGPAGYGVRIENAAGTLIEELRGAIGVATNNVAEYRGLLAALSYLDEHGYRDVTIRSDSELLTKQMTGRFRVRHPRLQPLHRQATTLVERVGRVRFEHVPRADNAEADRLANEAMDRAAGQDRARPSVTTAQAESVSGSAASSLAAVASSVIAIGIDIESIARVDELWQRYGDRFVGRLFTDEEAAYCLRRRQPAQHLAGRFAAKEAGMKALGTGRSQGVLWRDIEVVRVSGPPQLRLHGGAARRFAAIGGQRALVTITHAADLAMAHVLFTGT